MLLQANESQSDVRDEDITHRGPGIMVLSSQLRPLHMNQRASILLHDLVRATPEAELLNQTGELPSLILSLATKILNALRRRGEAGEHRQCEICYLANNSRRQVVIRCMGVAGPNGPESERIVLVLTDTQENHAITESLPAQES